MEDECSIEELTAFLEASDDENETEADKPVDKDDEAIVEAKDEVKEEDIEAFLEESDDEEEVKDKQPAEPSIQHTGDKNEEDIAKPQTNGMDEENNYEFDDMDFDELDELDRIASQAENTKQPSSTSSSQGTDDKQDDDDDKTESQEQDGDAAVRSEMAAMAARIKQLEAMLSKKAESSESSTTDKHKNRKSSSSDGHSSKSPSSHKYSSKSSSSDKHSSKSSSSYKHSSKSSSSHKHSSKSPSSHKHSSKSPSSHKHSSKSPSSHKHSSKSPSSHKHSSNSPSSHKHSSKSPSSHKHSSKSSEKIIANGHTSHERKSSSSKTTSQSTPSRDRDKIIAKLQSGEKLARKSEAESKHKAKYTENKLSQVKDEADSLFSTKMKAANRVLSPSISNSTSQVPRVASPETTVDAKTLFGDSDDSDWDELDGGEKSKLSEEGRELKKLLTNGPRKREAHTASYDPAILKKPDLKSWTEKSSPRTFLSSNGPARRPPQPEKPALDPKTGTVSGKYQLKDEYKPRTTVIQKEDERASVTDPFCGIRIINPRVSMEEFRSKMAGRNIMKIPQLLAKAGTSDLQKENWVTMGVVVHKTEPRQSASGKTYCIWKLSDLQNCDRTVTFFLFGNVYRDHWKNDLGVVIGLLNPSLMDKAEKAQSEVAFTINHPGQLLVLGISKDLGRCRGTTKAGQACSSFINKMQGEFCTYHVQAAYRKSSSKRTELQASTGVEPKAFQQRKNGNSSGFFFYGGNTFSSMKPQAKANKDKMNLQKLQSFENKKSVGKVTTMSLHELQPQDKAKLAKIEEKDQKLLELLAVPTAGAMNFVKHLVVNKDGKKVAEGSDKPDAEAVSAKDLLKQHQAEIQRKKMLARRPDPLKATPTLGKGFSFGQEISLDVGVKKSNTTVAAELKKQLAIAKLKAKGGIEKEDPNAVRKKLTSPEAKDKIKKRVAACMDMEDEKTGDKKTHSEPPKKKSKFLGDLDLNSPEVQALLKSKSKHTGALAEAEAEHEDKYFSALEQKERMEDKMAAIMEVPVSLVMCLQCKYKYFSLSDRCKKENHPFKRVKGTKRFFKCKQCKRRSVCLDKLPTASCKDCGATNFERVSMLKERSGPKLESEELCIRGNEQKYVGSVQGKAFLNV